MQTNHNEKIQKIAKKLVDAYESCLASGVQPEEYAHMCRVFLNADQELHKLMKEEGHVPLL